ncbi:hypothetical protein LAWI1_G003542 [Lachnellula willkommii]|uniref:Enoyl reductase (ER) domain-containing protein n=1 Tax=Lachnellula willkommii TaxID=215461 RepID=A0A559M5B2_9HELO|nr:hypothetical protein LAWI1_G003542 [Lachnellula willkommii]
MRAIVIVKQGAPREAFTIEDSYPKPGIDGKEKKVLLRVKCFGTSPALFTVLVKTLQAPHLLLGSHAGDDCQVRSEQDGSLCFFALVCEIGKDWIAAIGHADRMTRKGVKLGGAERPPIPKVLGSECAGVVVAVPPDLERQDSDGPETRTGGEGAKYKVGDVVMTLMGGMGFAIDGCYAEYVAAPPMALSAPVAFENPTSLQLSCPSSAPIDTSRFYATLAAVPGALPVARGILVTSLRVQADDTLLIHGGSSSVGMAAATIAKNLLGVKKIAGTTRNQAKVAKMKSGGFDVVIVLQPEHTKSLNAGELSALIKKEGTESLGFTAQIEMLGATHVATSLACARPSVGSRVCVAGMLAGAYHISDADKFSPMGIVNGHLSSLASLAQAAIEGKVNAGPDKIFKFEEIIKAHEYCEADAVSPAAPLDYRVTRG